MNAKQLNQTYPIVQFLSLRGFAAIKIAGCNHWYISMIRDDVEKTPSFKVDIKLNLWYDHGIGKGGNLVDLACLILKTANVSLVIRELNTNFSSFHPLQNFVGVAATNHNNSSPAFKILSVEELTFPPLIEYLAKRGIDKEIGKMYCQQVSYVNSGRHFRSIGFPNRAGGFELRSEGFKSCLSPKDVTFHDNGYDKLAVFEGFIDFLSYHMLPDFMIEKSNWLILNSLSFLPKALEIFSKHRQLFLFLDNDLAAQTSKRRINAMQFNCVDMSVFYNDFKDLNDYLLWTRKNC